MGKYNNENQAKYAAAPIMCGWAGAGIKKVTSAYRLELWGKKKAQNIVKVNRLQAIGARGRLMDRRMGFMDKSRIAHD